MRLTNAIKYPRTAIRYGAHVEILPGSSPLVLSMPHIGVEIPDDFQHNLNLGLKEAVDTLHGGVDFTVPFATGAFNYYDAARIWTRLPRVVLDVKRSLGDVDQYAVQGAKGVAKGHGLVWHASSGFTPQSTKSILERPYTMSEFLGMVAHGYAPYVVGVRSLVEHARENNGHAILVGLHSMPPYNFSHHTNGRFAGAYYWLRGGDPLPDIIMTSPEKGSCDPELIDLVRETFKEHGYSVSHRRVAPASISLPRDKVADPENGIHLLAIEIVGHGFQAEGIDGVIYHDIEKKFPAELARMRTAFTDVFQRLEAWH